MIKYYIMRIDKFLKVSRILKRRSVANDACSANRVSVNGVVKKPSYRLNVGDIVEVAFGTNVLKFKVIALNEYVKKEDAEKMYEVIND